MGGLEILHAAFVCNCQWHGPREWYRGTMRGNSRGAVSLLVHNQVLNTARVGVELLVTA